MFINIKPLQFESFTFCSPVLVLKCFFHLEITINKINLVVILKMYNRRDCKTKTNQDICCSSRKYTHTQKPQNQRDYRNLMIIKYMKRQKIV